MPIENGEIRYEMPDYIKAKFTKEFLSDFHKRTIKIFKENDIKLGREPGNYEKETYFSWWAYMEGTSGLCKSFMKTCRKFGLDNVVDYYSKLDWFDSDLFDDELVEMLIKYGLIEEGNPNEI